MPALKIAIQTASLRLPLRKALIAAARLGASAVEIDARNELRPRELSTTALRELRGLLEDLNLRVASIAFVTRRGYDTADDLDRRVEATQEAMRLAYQLRAPIVINQIGRVPAESAGPAWESLVQVLTDLGRAGDREGARLAAQTGRESGADLARLLAALPADSVGVDFDPGSLLINGFSPAEAIEALAPRVAQLRVRDAVHDLSQGRGIEVPLGRGSIDFAALLGALEERAFRGYALIARQHADQPEAEIGAAVEYLKTGLMT